MNVQGADLSERGEVDDMLFEDSGSDCDRATLLPHQA